MTSDVGVMALPSIAPITPNAFSHSPLSPRHFITVQYVDICMRIHACVSALACMHVRGFVCAHTHAVARMQLCVSVYVTLNSNDEVCGYVRVL